MTYFLRVVCLTLVGAFAILMAQAVAGETRAAKKTTSDAPVEEEVAPKSLKAQPDADALKKAAEARAIPLPNDFWISGVGAFRLTGTRGKGIYEFLGDRYDHGFSFADSNDVGSLQGWTSLFPFYLFFSMVPTAACGDKWPILWSADNVAFSHYVCAS
jgi:hypothetical protein